ncbi:diguanylate cyclase domain-containing protein [Marinomonas colpomeniae]|uniref:Diguanylate cyclase n=1 Tax=Marinomonas colpomeniae TaxID=2774408 RepID=A0ABR8NXZ9_9GAMM|nr:diguanylate cyclase [Marinomonas colpomeniae]MBD5770918.1 diguanylate cyclase [Marinomonas colpomeniae]
MTIDVSNTLFDKQQEMQSRIAYLEKERDFIKVLYGDMPETLQVIAKGAPLSALLNRFKNKLQTQLPNAYCLFIECDKDCLQWRLQYSDLINENLLDTNGQLVTLPQDLIVFAATSSSRKRHCTDIQNASGWEHWKSFLETNSLTEVSMISVPNGRGSIHLMLAFQKGNSLLDGDLMELALEGYSSWVNAAFEREKADFLLLEDNHRNSETGLLRRFSFENSFEIVLKDSRRHFQRTALLSLRLLSRAEIDKAELKILADVMRDVVRDNDLIAHYDERELVMGIRIQHLEDAEVVAKKLLETLGASKYSTNQLIRAGLSIGIAFYPEHSSIESLHQAASLASHSLKNTSGFRLEFHDALYDTSAAFYS